MTPYGALKTAIYRRSGQYIDAKGVDQRQRVCSGWEVRHELAAYLQQFRVVAKDPFTHKPIDWNDLYTRDEWFAQVNKKKARRKKEYDTLGGERLAIQEHAPDLDDEHDGDLDWIDNYAAKQRREIEDDSYHAEW